MAANQAKITLYWLNKSRSHRILVMLEHLKVPYEMKVFKRQKDMLAPPEMKKVHQLGKGPILGVLPPGADKEIIIPESGTIVEYLADHFGKQMIPKRWVDGKEDQVGGETEGWMRYRHLMHYAEGSLMSLMVVGLVVNEIANAPAPFFIKPILRQIGNRVRSGFLNANYATNFDFVESQLASNPDGGEFFCGKELSGADILMLFPLEAAVHASLAKREKYPKIAAWVDRMHALDAYKSAIKKAEEAGGEKIESPI